MTEYSVPAFPPWLRAYLGPDVPDTYQWEVWAKGERHWISNQGPQTWVVLCPYDEICIGGRRGGSKSAALIGWSAAGDFALDDDDPARISFLNDPYFRGLFLRKEYQAMDEFIDEAYDFFRPFGVKKKGNPVEFHFDSGAIWYTNHLQNKEAYEKYRGQGLTKIGIEELTQIEEQDSYLKLLGSLRGKKQIRMVNGKQRPPLRVQIMSTTNPDGVGAPWVKKRFPMMVDGKGDRIPWNTPARNPASGLTRIFIPMKREDNPYLRDNKSYEGMLREQSPLKQKQWIDGDWDAAAGRYFEMFRPNGPSGEQEASETPWARHVIEPVHLRHYWYRFGGGDWGYQHKAVFHKGCKNELDGRIHIYDELTLRQVGSEEMGILLAKWWLPDLERLPDKTVTVALSPDAFNKTDATKTRAEQICDGIAKVLGPYGSFLMRYTDEEREAMKRNPDIAQTMFRQRQASRPKGSMQIIIQMARNSRVDGWGYIIDLLRFKPALRETEEELVRRIQTNFGPDNTEMYEREIAKFQRRDRPEVLPALVLWRVCREAIRGLTDAVHDEEPRHEDVRKTHAVNGEGGDDGLDSCVVENTKVRNQDGSKRISEIRVGELVWTRVGLRRVLASGKTGSNRKTITVKFSNGSELTATGNHPVLVRGRGWKRLDELRYLDTVIVWPGTKLLSSMESSFDGIQTRQDSNIGSISAQAETIGSEASARSTRKSGSPYMALFQRDSIFTTSARTPSTITSKTSNVSVGSTTYQCTGKSRISSGFARWLLSGGNSRRLGTLLRKAWSGIASTELRYSLIGPWSTAYVSSAGQHTKQALPGNPGSVRTSVKPQAEYHLESTTSQNHARAVERCSSRIDTPGQSAVPVYVLSVSEGPISDVYNLTVEGQPEYYANGILVHNCRYTLMSFKEFAAKMPRTYWIGEQMDKAQMEHEEAFGERITDQTRLAMISQTQAARFDKANLSTSGRFNLPRAGSHRHWGQQK